MPSPAEVHAVASRLLSRGEITKPQFHQIEGRYMDAEFCDELVSAAAAPEDERRRRLGALIGYTAEPGGVTNDSPDDSGGANFIGWVFVAAGVALALFATFGFDTGIRTSSGEEIYNMGLLARGTNLTVLGSALAIAGAVVLCRPTRPAASV